MRHRLYWLAAASLAFTTLACSPKQAPVVEETVKESSAKAPAKRGPGVEILHRYTTAPQRNTLIEIERYEDGTYKTYDGMAIDASAVAALAKAAQTDLLPSDGLYTCRPDGKRPEFEVKFEEDGRRYELFSNSHCLHEAPWNVAIDGVAHVQLSGAVGVALRAVLREAQPEAWDENYAPGVIQLAHSARLPEGWQANGSLDAHWFASLREEGALSSLTAEDALPELKLACEQESAPTCERLVGYMRSQVAEHVRYTTILSWDSKDGWSYSVPSDWEQGQRLLGTQVAKALIASDADGFTLEREESEDCHLQQTLHPEFKDGASLPARKSCVVWALRPVAVDNKFVLPPSLVYYPDLDAIWIAYYEDVNSTDLFSEHFKAKRMERYTDSRVSLFVALPKETLRGFMTTGEETKPLPASHFK